MKNVLVLCTGNSCRSQIAHAYLEKFSGDKAKVYSAGVEVHGVNPKTVQTLKDDGIDISHYTSNHVDEYRNIPFDYVITVCDNARERCPYFPGGTIQLHQNFQDPSKSQGTEDEVMHEFARVRDQIKQYAEEFVQNNL
jgi:arsenate reductase